SLSLRWWRSQSGNPVLRVASARLPAVRPAGHLRVTRCAYNGSVACAAVHDSWRLSGACFRLNASVNERMPNPVLLVAEDDPNDALLLERALRRTGSPFKLMHVANGELLIAYLEGEGGYSDRAKFPHPWVILLDLKMPRKDGFSV